MPTYEIECKKCNHKFDLMQSGADHGKHREKCPECGSAQISSLISSVNVITSRKS